MHGDAVEFLNWFVRHSYWMFNLGVVVGCGVTVGAWYGVQKALAWRERHNYEVWAQYIHPRQPRAAERKLAARAS